MTEVESSTLEKIIMELEGTQIYKKRVHLKAAFCRDTEMQDEFAHAFDLACSAMQNEEFASFRECTEQVSKVPWTDFMNKVEDISVRRHEQGLSCVDELWYLAVEFTPQFLSLLRSLQEANEVPPAAAFRGVKKLNLISK